jgi:hypothetical protein
MGSAVLSIIPKTALPLFYKRTQYQRFTLALGVIVGEILLGP